MNELEKYVLSIWSKLVKFRKLLFFFSSTGLMAGLLIAILVPSKYTASSSILPSQTEDLSTSIGSLGGLAGLAGISIPTSNQVMSSKIYPDLIASTPFVRSVLDDTIVRSDSPRITLRSYLDFEAENGYGAKIKSWITSLRKNNESNFETNYLTRTELSKIERVRSLFSIELDPRTQIITVNTTIDDRLISAEINRLIIEQLDDFLTSYANGEILSKIEFLEERYSEAEKVYNHAQAKYAEGLDQNINLNTASSSIEIENLKNRLDISFQVLREISLQLEKSRIEESEQQKPFVVIEPVTIPLEPSSLSGLLTVALAVILMVVLGSCYIVLFR